MTVSSINKKKKVIVGLSGGVDSSVAAYLLSKDKRYDVSALFMVNWHDRDVTLQSNCTWEDDWELAQMVARKIGIPIELVDLSEDYRRQVVDYMFTEYEHGRTPNPDVLCNREIKFLSFLQEADKRNADFLATGHYCRKTETEGKYHLLAGVDTNKDQSYFLCQLTQQQLSKALFPIGHLQKSRVREIAREAQLPTAERKDSQGICFVGKVDLPTFLQQKLQPQQGDIIQIPASFYENKPMPTTIDENNLRTVCKPFLYKPWMGTKVGTHNGAYYFTIGQRKGIGIGGTKEPLFVIGIDVKRNILYVGEGSEHPGLLRKGLLVDRDIHWLQDKGEIMPKGQTQFDVRIRYRQKLVKANLFEQPEGIFIVFDTPERGVTAGQFAAWYQNDELIGSGVIK